MRIGVDIGGTFTDFVIYHPDTQQVETFKLLSTPHNPAEAMLRALPDRWPNVKGRSSTAQPLRPMPCWSAKGQRPPWSPPKDSGMCSRSAARTAPASTTCSAAPPEPLIPRQWRFEVTERVSHQGEVLTPWKKINFPRWSSKSKLPGIESVAVCLLFSFLHPAHEEAIRQVLEEAGVFVSISSQVLPTFREYERTSTTAANAYVSPVMDRYLARPCDQTQPLTICRSCSPTVAASNQTSPAPMRCAASSPVRLAVP